MIKPKPIAKEYLVEQVFKNRRTQKEIAQELGCHVGTVERYMKKYELTNQMERRYEAKAHLLVPSNPYFIYTVGLWLTDGSIAINGRLAIRINDSDVIKVLSSYFDVPMYSFRNNTFEVNFPVLCTSLISYCRALCDDVKTKTFSVKCPLDIKDEKLKWLLLRGIIDGDGAIRPDSSSIRIFTASKPFADTLIKFLNSLKVSPSVLPTIYGKSKKVGWTIYIGVKDTPRVLIKTYEDIPELAIQRKRDCVKTKVKEIVQTYKMINCKKW